MLGEFGDFQQDGMQTLGGPRQAPACEPAGFLLQGVVSTVEHPREQLIIMAKLEQLGVGVFQQLDRGQPRRCCRKGRRRSSR